MMNEKNGNLLEGMSEEDLNMLVGVLNEAKPEEVKNMEKSFTKAEPTDSIEEAIGHIVTDVDGNIIPIIAEEESTNSDIYKNNESLSPEEIVAGKLDVKNDELAKESVKGFFEAVFDDGEKTEGDDNKSSLSDEDALLLLQSIQEYQRGVKKNYYNFLPNKMKQAINNMIIGSGEAPTAPNRNAAAKMLLDQFISEINLNQEYIDLETTMRNTLDIPSIPDIYSDYIREMMEDQTLAMANRVEEESPDKAKLLRDVSAAFTSSYTYDKMIDFLKNNRKARNHISKDRPKYKKFCNDFNYYSNNSKFKINDIFMAGDVLMRMIEHGEPLDNFNENDVIDFIILLCKTCESMDRNDIVDCAFIYHVVKNIVMLDYRANTLTDFTTTIIDNIKLTMVEIEEMEIEHERMTQNVKSKSKKSNHSK